MRAAADRSPTPPHTSDKRNAKAADLRQDDVQALCSHWGVVTGEFVRLSGELTLLRDVVFDPRRGPASVPACRLSRPRSAEGAERADHP
jgi:hypothetical protein